MPNATGIFYPSHRVLPSSPLWRPASMKVSRYMTQKLITATPDMWVKQAFLLMRTHRVRHIPVVEGDKLGISDDPGGRRNSTTGPPITR